MAIWHNGTIGDTASIDASSAGLLLGWGVFTTIGLQKGRPLWLDQHLRRLRRDAAKCDLEIPFSDEALHDGLNALLRATTPRNGLARITATRRDDGRWNTTPGTDLTILTTPAPPPKTRHLRVGLAPAPSQGELAGVKTTSYLPYFWSWHQTQKRGWDEVLLLNDGGFIIEAARSTVFWAQDGILGTAPLALGALEGVGRELVLEWAQTSGIKTSLTPTTPHDLTRHHELFLVSAATGPRSITTLCLPTHEAHLPAPQPIFESLRAWWDSQ